jgi:glutathione S-transferase
MRVRWALEEVDQPYDVRLVTFPEMKAPPHLGIHPFGQIPTYEEGELQLFESGAIVLHIAERHGGLLPANADARSRAIAWMFAAVNTVEPPWSRSKPPTSSRRDKPWHAQRLALLQKSAHTRLLSLSHRLGTAQWLDGDFSAGDLMMIGVLFRTRDIGRLERYPNLRDYVARGESRPAFQRAFAAQRAVFAARQRGERGYSASRIRLNGARRLMSASGRVRPDRRDRFRAPHVQRLHCGAELSGVAFKWRPEAVLWLPRFDARKPTLDSAAQLVCWWR